MLAYEKYQMKFFEQQKMSKYPQLFIGCTYLY